VCPLPDSAVRCRPSGQWFHPPTLVPSSWFLTTSTVSSTQGLRVCCTPLPALGFTAFPAPESRCFRRSSGRQDAFPAMRARTLRRVPLASSRTASLRPLPSCLCRSPHPPLRVRLAWCVVTMLRFAKANPHFVSRLLVRAPKRVDLRARFRCLASLTWDLCCRRSRRGLAPESSRLQGLAPPTSPLPPCHRCQ
jgi:hypothetical protein